MKKKVKIIIAAAASAVLLCFAAIYFIRVEKTDIEGLSGQSAQVVTEAIFENNNIRSVVILYLQNKFSAKKTIPLIEDYDIEITGIRSILVTVYEKSVVGYVENMGYKWYFDKDGIITECVKDAADKIPCISGMRFDYMVVGDRLPIHDKSAFNMILEITQLIKKHEMRAEKVHMDADGAIYVNIGNVTVALGNGDMLNEKMQDLNDIIPTMEDVKGVLDMRDYDAGRKGYTFKREKAT